MGELFKQQKYAIFKGWAPFGLKGDISAKILHCRIKILLNPVSKSEITQHALSHLVVLKNYKSFTASQIVLSRSVVLVY